MLFYIIIIYYFLKISPFDSLDKSIFIFMNTEKYGLNVYFASNSNIKLENPKRINLKLL